MRTTTRAAVAAAAVAVAASGMLSLSAATATADPVGPGCGDYVRQVPVGPGSVMGMAADPVTVAASNNPLLTTLTAALSGQLNPNVNLVNTLNGGEFTVFAPTDDAFGKIPPATIDSLKTDSATLTKILTYHGRSCQRRRHPHDRRGRQRDGDRIARRVKGHNASVACGGVNTGNATVYLIDTVLMPPAHRLHM